MNIISKDRKQIVNGDNINRLYANGEKIMVEYTNGYRSQIGRYNSTEDTAAVMAMMIESVQECLVVWELPPDEIVAAYRNEMKLQQMREGGSE